MKLYVIALSFVLFTWNSTVFAGGDPAQDPLSCDVPACEQVASEVDYHDATLKKSFALKMDHFSLEIPDQPIQKIVTSKDEIMIFYAGGQLLYLSESRGPNIQDLPSDIISQYPGNIFTKTTKDPLSEGGLEKLFQKMALASKPFYFQGASEVVFSKRDGFTYYLSDSPELGFSGRAMVTSSELKQVFLVIEAKKMEFDEFKEVVYSVK